MSDSHCGHILIQLGERFAEILARSLFETNKKPQTQTQKNIKELKKEKRSSNQAKVWNECHSLTWMQDISSNRETLATYTPQWQKTCQTGSWNNSFPTFDLLESPKLANAKWKADDAGKESSRANAFRRGSYLTSMVCEGWNFRSRL